MNVKDSVALVTGANRGVGAAFVRTLLDRGAAKVYAAMRSTEGYEAPDGRVQPIEIDVTNHDRIARAVAECGDVTLLVNNAGVNHNQPISARRRPGERPRRDGRQLLRHHGDVPAVRPGAGRQRRRWHRQHAVDPESGESADDRHLLRLQGRHPCR